MGTSLDIAFESRRLYVAARRSVLFFARAGEHRVRCYIHEDVLPEHIRALRDDLDVVQRSLLAFDRHRDSICEAARRVIERMSEDELANAVIVPSDLLDVDPEVPLTALEAVR